MSELNYKQVRDLLAGNSTVDSDVVTVTIGVLKELVGGIDGDEYDAGYEAGHADGISDAINRIEYG